MSSKFGIAHLYVKGKCIEDKLREKCNNNLGFNIGNLIVERE